MGNRCACFLIATSSVKGLEAGDVTGRLETRGSSVCSREIGFAGTTDGAKVWPRALDTMRLRGSEMV